MASLIPSVYQEQGVSLLQRDRLLAVGATRGDPKRQSHYVRSDLDKFAAGPPQNRQRMAGVDQRDLMRGGIQQTMTKVTNRSAYALRRSFNLQRALAESPPRRKSLRLGRQFGHQHGRGEAMPHHVGHDHRRAAIGERNIIIVVAADVVHRLIEIVKLVTLTADSVGKK